MTPIQAAGRKREPSGRTPMESAVGRWWVARTRPTRAGAPRRRMGTAIAAVLAFVPLLTLVGPGGPLPAEAAAALAATPTAGSWSPTGSLTTSRWDFGRGPSQTLLRDGRVLVAGGFSRANGMLASAELYDPSSGIWTPTGGMGTARIDAAATPLGGPACAASSAPAYCGKVLVAGGSSFSDGALASAELYDPSSGIWSPAGSMTTSRGRPTAALLSDGKVLVTGSGGKSAELYDPSSGTWSRTGDMNEFRTGATATRLKNGKVLLVGGGPGAELYDAATGTFSRTGDPFGLNSPTNYRASHTATLLADGRVLVVGGCCRDPGRYGAVSVNSAEIYDPLKGTWTRAASLPTPRSGHAATLLANGKVLVAGGVDDTLAGCCPLASAVLYNPVPGRWESARSMAAARGWPNATRLQNGNVLVVGGIGADGGPLLSAEVYTP